MNKLSRWLRSVLDHKDEDIFHQPIYEAFWDTLNPSPNESMLAINCRHTELFRSALPMRYAFSFCLYLKQ